MTRSRLSRLVGGILVLIGSANAGAQIQDPQRDLPKPGSPTVKTGTATVSGKITLPGDGTNPVRRAIVSLTSADGTDHRSVVTSDDGAFTFRAVPAARYTLTAEKPAHLKSSYGARRPGRPGTAIVVNEGQQVTGLTWTLPRGGVIAGFLTTVTGEPMVNTQVMAIPVALAKAGGTSTGQPGFVTDDLGAYRIYGLTPGDYLIAALPVVGRGDVEERTEAEYEALVRAFTQRSPTAGPAPASPIPTPAATRGYAPTYYPGTPVPTQAVPIRLGIGDVREGIDIPITMYPIATITGRVLGTNGAPMRAVQLTTDLVGPTLPLSTSLSIRNTLPDAQGRFTISNVPPGSYRVTARAGGVTLNSDGSMQSTSSQSQTEWAFADVHVTGDNIDGITLALRPGLTFSGRLRTAESSAAPDSWKGARVTIEPARQGGAGVSNPFSGIVARSGPAADDGTFVVTGIPPGNYYVIVEPPKSMGTEWAVRSVVSGTRDLRDAPLTFEDGSLVDVAITLSNQPSVVTGTLSSTAGTPAANYDVVLFPADKSLWYPGSLRVLTTRPGADGLFTFRDLLAGEYRLAALTDVEDDELRSTAFLESLIASSVTLTVKEGATTRQDIRIR